MVGRVNFMWKKALGHCGRSSDGAFRLRSVAVCRDGFSSNCGHSPPISSLWEEIGPEQR